MRVVEKVALDAPCVVEHLPPLDNRVHGEFQRSAQRLVRLRALGGVGDEPLITARDEHLFSIGGNLVAARAVEHRLLRARFYVVVAERRVAAGCAGARRPAEDDLAGQRADLNQPPAAHGQDDSAPLEAVEIDLHFFRMRNVGGFVGVAFFILRFFVGGLRLGGFDGCLGWLVALLRVLRFFLRLVRLRFVVLFFLLLRLVLFERLLVIPRRERRRDVLAQRHADERVAVHVGPRVVEVAVERVEIPFAAVKKIVPRRVKHRLVVIVIRARHLMPFARLHIVNHDGVELAVCVACVGEPAAVAAPVHFESIELAVIHPQLFVNLLRLLRVEIV